MISLGPKIHISGKLKIVSRGPPCLEFSFWYKKASNAEKASFCCAEPSDCIPNLPLKTLKLKKNPSFLIATILCFPEYYLIKLGPKNSIILLSICMFVARL